MTQDIDNPKYYIADEGKCFRRIHNGFTAIENPYIVGTALILGQILIDDKGMKLDEPIDDKIEYYEEVDMPKNEWAEENNVTEE